MRQCLNFKTRLKIWKNQLKINSIQFSNLLRFKVKISSKIKQKHMHKQQQQMLKKIIFNKQKNNKNNKKKKEKEKYREKRLVIQVDKEVAKNIDSYTLRNQINDRFFVKENINSPVIATITKSFTSQSIILTTMTDFSADFLLQKKTVWED